MSYAPPTYGGYTSTTPYATTTNAGFLPSDIPPSQNIETPGKKRLEHQSVRPVTIRQLTLTTIPHAETPVQIDGSDVHAITFVGRVVAQKDTTTTITYTIEDGTGIWDVKKWIEQSDTEYEQEKRTNIR